MTQQVKNRSRGKTSMIFLLLMMTVTSQDNADAILGHASLSRFNLIFDYAGKMLYLKPNRHFHDPYD